MSIRRSCSLLIVFILALTLTGCAGGGGRFKLDPGLRKEIVVFGGHQYVPLARACDTYGIRCDWDTYTRKATLTKGPYTVVAMAGSDRILVNGLEKRLPQPVRLDAGTVYVPVALVGKNLVLAVDVPIPLKDVPPAAVVPAEPVKQITINTVVLDAGHGGKDVGAVGRHHRLQEKDKALAVAQDIRAILEKNGLTVIMTRDGDAFIPLPERAEAANKIGADLFVSVHINSSRTRLLRGFECYYLSDATDDSARALEALENSSLKLGEGAGAERSSGLDKTLWDLTLTENRIESAELAEDICRSVDGAIPINNRGVKTAKFYVLKHTNMPSVLVEVCYLSNRYDETMLKDAKFQARVAEAVARGIVQYKKDFEKTEGFTNL